MARIGNRGKTFPRARRQKRIIRPGELFTPQGLPKIKIGTQIVSFASLPSKSAGRKGVLSFRTKEGMKEGTACFAYRYLGKYLSPGKMLATREWNSKEGVFVPIKPKIVLHTDFICRAKFKQKQGK